jgi:hypothetical protein
VERSVDEERWRSLNARAQPARYVFLDPRPVATFAQRRVELTDVHPDLTCIAAKVGQLERLLALEEQIVHLPEAILSGGLLGGLGGELGVRVDLAKREMAEDEAEPVAEVALDRLHGAVCGARVGTLVVPVHEQRHGRGRFAPTDAVAAGVGGSGEHRASSLLHQLGGNIRARVGPLVLYGAESSTYVTPAEHPDVLPAPSAARARNTVVELSGTETEMPGDLNRLAVPLATGEPVQAVVL